MHSFEGIHESRAGAHYGYLVVYLELFGVIYLELGYLKFSATAGMFASPRIFTGTEACYQTFKLYQE